MRSYPYDEQLEIPRERIRARAYELWQQRGRPLGDDQHDWFEAEEELRREPGYGRHGWLPAGSQPA